MKRKRVLADLLAVSLFLLLAVSLNNFSCFAVEKPGPAAGKAAGSGAAPALLPKNVFKDKETIKFRVFSTGIKTGSGALTYHGTETQGGRPVQHVTFDVSTFNVRDKEEVYGALDFSGPILVKRQIKLFGNHETITENYSPDKKTLTISKSVNHERATTQTIVSEKELGNVLLLIYRLRNEASLKVGAVFRIVLPTQQFDLIVKSKKSIRVPLGTFEAYYLESSPAKYKIWISAGKDRLPVRIQGLVAGGMMYLAASELL